MIYGKAERFKVSGGISKVMSSNEVLGYELEGDQIFGM
jgi:hypothetical protein